MFSSATMALSTDFLVLGQQISPQSDFDLSRLVLQSVVRFFLILRQTKIDGFESPSGFTFAELVNNKSE